MLIDLNEAEKTLLGAVTSGIDCKAAKQEIRAEALRVMLLRIRDSALPEKFYESACPHWTIDGAIFKETVDLENGRLPDGAPLPGLKFIGCEFHCGFNGQGAHFERLTFESCTFHCRAPKAKDPSEDTPKDQPETKAGPAATDNKEAQKKEPAVQCPIRLRNATIGSELLFFDMKPCEEKAFLTIDASATRIGTHVTLKKVVLRAPENQEVEPDGTTHYALDLAESRIGGSLFIGPDVEAQGGIRLRAAEIACDVWAIGILLNDGNTQKSRPSPTKSRRLALNAQGVHVGGLLSLTTYSERSRKNQRVDGEISFAWSTMGGAQLQGIEMVDCFSLLFNDATVRGNIRIGYLDLPPGRIPTKISGFLVLNNCRVEGSVTIQGRFGEENSFSAVCLQWCEIAGTFLLAGELHRIEALGLSVGGDASVASHSIRGQLTRLVSIIDLASARFGGILSLARLLLDGNVQEEFISKRPILSMHCAKIEKTLSISQHPPFLRHGKGFDRSLSVNIPCLTGFSFIQLALMPNPMSEADRLLWDGNRTAYVSFIRGCDEKEVELIVGGALNGVDFVRRALQKIRDDEIDKWADYLRLFCSCLSAFEKYESFFSILEDEKQLPKSLQDFVEKKKDKDQLSGPRENFGKIRIEPIKLEKGWLYRDEKEEKLRGLKCLTFVAYIYYKGQVHKAEMHVYQDGAVRYGKEIEQDLLKYCRVQESRVYELPFRFGEDAARPDYLPLLKEGKPLTDREVENLLPGWQGIITSSHRQGTPDPLEGQQIDLRDCSCGTLDDNEGKGWLGAKLLLENFTYTRLSTPLLEKKKAEQPPSDKVANPFPSMRPWLAAGKQLLRSYVEYCKNALQARVRRPIRIFQEIFGLSRRDSDRLGWLRKISDELPVFGPQPFSQLAGVLRSQGDEEAAREIDEEKLKRLYKKYVADAKERNDFWKKWWWRGWSFFYGFCFGYGLRIGRAVITLVVCWTLGAMGFLAANRYQMMLKTDAPVAKMTVEPIDRSTTALVYSAKENAPKTPLRRIVSTPPKYGIAATDPLQTDAKVPCGGDLNPFLYAVESFTPFLNLHQESRCEIRAPSDGDTRWRWITLRALEVWKFFYQIIGYVMTSLAVLTFSGIARKWDQK